MPELPDLEVYKKNLFLQLKSKEVLGVTVYNLQKVYTPEAALQDELAGSTLLGVSRVGKELFFDFGAGRFLSAHLMLNGEMSLVPDTAVDAIKFKIFALRFKAQTLVFSDRGFLCTIKYKPVRSKVPDAFGADFTMDYFLLMAHKKPRMNIKAFLIDQSIVKGIGNAYADEILWAARVSPRCLTGRVPDEALAALYKAIRSVLEAAVTSIKEISPDRISGEERSFLKVHNKALKRTETGYAITVEKIASKITYHTDEQVFYP